MDPQSAWNVAYNQLELQLDRASFEWVRGAVLLRVEDEVYIIGVRNNYARDMLQHRLYRNVSRVLSDVCGYSVELRFEVHKPPAKLSFENPDDDMPLFRLLAEQQTTAPAEDTPLHTQVNRPERATLPESDLNPRFTFDRYIVSSANRMAYEAARAVAEHPGRHYNPFMLYGSVGLGKTHLLQAIAHVCQAKGLKVIYVSSEAFTNDLVDSIRQRTMAMFRERYRSVDVLLVDDVQFISGKDSTQEEFFHTFNALVTFNKQIILVSDRHPRELSTLEDRLRSRFEGGLVMDVPPLELETRIAIVEMWAQERRINLPRNVAEMLAERACNNVRELEGAFNQVIAQSQLSGEPPSIAMTAHVLQRYESPRQHGRKVSLADVINATAQHFNIKKPELVGKGRAQRVNLARQVAMYLARELTEASLLQIGDALGGRSHTTVLHGCNKIVETLEEDVMVSHIVRGIRQQLLGD